jgi:hypothetical protein
MRTIMEGTKLPGMKTLINAKQNEDAPIERRVVDLTSGKYAQPIERGRFKLLGVG